MFRIFQPTSLALIALVGAAHAGAPPTSAPSAAQGQANPDGSITWFTGNGTLTVEVDKPEDVYRAMQDLVTRSGASVTSYSLSLTPNTSFTSISATVVGDVSQGESILRELSRLGRPTSQSYYQSRQVVFPPEVVEAELARLKAALQKMTAPARPDFESLRALVNRIADTESRLRNARSNQSSSGTAGSKATISLQVHSTGLAAYSAKKQQDERQKQEERQLEMYAKTTQRSIGSYFSAFNLCLVLSAFLLGAIAGWALARPYFLLKRRAAG